MAIIKDVTVKINNGTATLDAPVQFYEKDHDVELRFRLMDYKYKYDKDPQNILNSVDEDVLEAYTTIVNPRGYELEQINGVVKNDVVIFRLDPTYTDELDELGTYKLQIHIKCTHSEFTIPPITFEVLQRLKGIKVVTDGEDEVDNSEILDNSSKFVSDETGKLIIEWKKGDMISSAKLNAMVDVINDAVDEEKIRQENEIEREKKANNKIQELENTRVEYVNKFDDELDSFADQVDTTMSDYETRFNALTVSQQQDAEVIDARDGEQTLRARLDRDIQKPSIMYEEVEGSHINVDTTCGYAQNVEILGNTIQNQNNLADIRSVGDKLENQELYEIPVLSANKNLFSYDFYDYSSYSQLDNAYVLKEIKLPVGIITISNKKIKDQTSDMGTLIMQFWDNTSYSTSNRTPMINSGWSASSQKIVTIEEGKKYYIAINITGNTLSKETILEKIKDMYEIQIEVGNTITPYEPYQEHKLTILSPVQLEKVGDVADRIICKDGVWGVEKSIKTKVYNGSEKWSSLANDTNSQFVISRDSDMQTGDLVICNQLTGTSINKFKDYTCYIGVGNFNVLLPSNISLSDFVNSLKSNNLILKYKNNQPQFIPLPHDQQIKLRTFANKTNIHFGCEIEPTLKASVPKSLGASVSSHTEQIDNLFKELDKVKKLEESTASTVTTESDFTTVENTSNGYFEDIKLEGRTLVNLCNNNSIKASGTLSLIELDTFKLIQEGTSEEVSCVTTMPLLANKEYTIVYNILNNNLSKNSLVLKGGHSKNIVKENIIINNSVGVNCFKFMPNDSGQGEYIRFAITSSEPEGNFVSIQKNVILLEGDHTQNPPSYFEGLMSVGQEVDEISVLSTNKEETKEDKKRILYYNDETQTWEKPILRQWDSIEKHSDGKYYYHKRSGEVVLNGNEFWELRPQSDSQDVIAFNGSGLTTSSNVLGVVCDKFPTIEAFGEGANFENIFIANSKRMQVRILKTKLSPQDVQGFKAWLQANNVTVVYQLAKEKVYECTDLDLITYADETNLMVKGGAIVPKTTLKVHKNIANIATILQEKVNRLENNVGHVNGEIDNINTDLTSLTESIEGSCISVDSKDGYLKDIEILGNTVQDQDNLADIRSVGDKVENQELYEIPVLSCGKNLTNMDIKIGIMHTSDGSFNANNSDYYSNVNFDVVKQNTQYAISSDKTINVVFFYDKDMKYISNQDIQTTSKVITTPSECRYIRYRFVVSNKPTWIQLEEGTQATPYEPYQEDKLTILSPVQLEKVGDVADRIICKDGVWGVEKNIETIVIDGSDKFGYWSATTQPTDSTLINIYVSKVLNYGKTNGMLICDKFVYGDSFVGGNCYTGGSGNIHFILPKTTFGDANVFKAWLQANPTTVMYQLAQPQFIPLPHDQQIKLRTFANKTNISFRCEIEPTLKASVPKSLSSTVSTHTEQIDNLGKELDKVKKLEESVASEVITESDFTTVEETSNGYFEDVKLEGKTLVNLSNLPGGDITISNRIGDGKITPLKQLTSSDTLYLTFNCTSINSDANLGIICAVSYKDDTPAEYKLIENGKTVGCKKIKIIPKSDVQHIVMYLHGDNSSSASATISDVVLMYEKDCDAQNPPSYFEGLMSVGQDVDEISVESMDVYKQLLYREGRNASYNEDFNIVSINDSTSNLFGEIVRVKQNTTYTIKFNESNNFNVRIYGYETIPTCPVTSPKQQLILVADGVVGDYSLTFTTGINVKYIFVGRYGGELFNTGYLINHKAKRINEVQLNKKPLLYYNNETQTLEKPILRQWDSIEKHTDGKYYYHQRSGEVVLNGSENWIIDNDAIKETSLHFRLNGASYNLKPTNDNHSIAELICDKFTPKNADFVWCTNTQNSNGVYEGITINTDSFICVRVLKSKLPTQDIAGFKQWLQANNVTVVYQLAKEKVYECTNLDLITYENETNFIVNTGAISPKSTLKVMCNITNVVRELQQKVSNLENYIQHVMIDALNNALNE